MKTVFEETWILFTILLYPKEFNKFSIPTKKISPPKAEIIKYFIIDSTFSIERFFFKNINRTREKDWHSMASQIEINCFERISHTELPKNKRKDIILFDSLNFIFFFIIKNKYNRNPVFKFTFTITNIRNKKKKVINMIIY